MQLSAFQKKVEEIEDKILPHDIEDDELAEAASLAIGSTYKHFKGATVKILDVARHSETKEAMVAYTHLDTGETWVRPLTMFMEKVEVKGKWVPRFKKITTK
ncbi:MAG: DUF1653 domain-containing protein [Pseudomonadales bacterium]|nr:DUF1653 domain-containing protein [Candidatus Woesebacteria bacterium]MCB9801814.1 DUF1653 domain-containing protein [Pseudomonadales bacterium]